jgi:hypothetical protein
LDKKCVLKVSGGGDAVDNVGEREQLIRLEEAMWIKMF